MSLIAKLQQEENIAKESAIVEYRSILARNSAPEAADAKKLRAVMAVLGFGVDRLSQDLAALDEARRLEGIVASLPADLAQQVADANQAWESHCAETERIKAEREAHETALFDRVRDLQRLAIAPRDARKTLAALKRRHWMLFGEPAPIAE